MKKGCQSIQAALFFALDAEDMPWVKPRHKKLLIIIEGVAEFDELFRIHIEFDDL